MPAEGSARATCELLQRAGLYWVPVPLGSKRPVERRWQEPRPRPLPGEDEPINVGLLLTRESGIVDVDLDSLLASRAAEVLVRPGPGVVRYGRRSKPVGHVLVRETDYRGPRRVLDPDARSLILEVRLDRQQSLVPPSVHPSGEQLRWVDDPEALTEMAPAGTAAGIVRRVAAAAVLAGGWERGLRHDAALALAGWLVRLGWAEEDVVLFCRAVAHAAGDEELADRAAAAAATVLRSQERETTGLPTLAELLGRARVELAHRLLTGAQPEGHGPRRSQVTLEMVLQALSGRDDLRVLRERPEVLYWQADWWHRGPFGQARPVVAQVLEQLGADASWFNKIAQVCQLVASGAVPELLVSEALLDATPRVLGLPSGLVLDLAAMEVRPARREELITRRTGVDYDPGVSTTLLVETLEAAAGPEAVAYLQLLAGVTLLGEPAKILVVVHGPTNTGKTLFLVDALCRALGDYAVQLDPHKVLHAGAERPELWLSRAVGRRCVVLSEPSREYRLNVQLIKAMTGRGTVTVRALYGQPMEVVPTWTVWIDTNWLPVVEDPDDAIWSRLRAVEFRNVIRPSRDDPRFDPRFLERWRREAPKQCLAWAVEGARKVLETGWDPTLLERSPADTTEEWRSVETEGSCTEFVATMLVPQPRGFVSRREVWEAYVAWTRQHPEKPVGRNTLYEIIRQMGIQEVKIGGERGFRAELRRPETQPDSPLAEALRWLVGREESP